MFLSQFCLFSSRIRSRFRILPPRASPVAACGLEVLTVAGQGILSSIPPIHCTPVWGPRFTSARSQALVLCATGFLGPGFLCSLPHQLGGGRVPHADLDADSVQTLDVYCTSAEGGMQTRKSVAADALQGCKVKKKILSPLRLPFRHAPEPVAATLSEALSPQDRMISCRPCRPVAPCASQSTQHHPMASKPCSPQGSLA
jgi:hypothetical protein